ncbi:transferrin-binding protein-like solute binding protein [Neisseria leonii]|uniref:transferrin-binding protein-like solute binding protein n=1 Tax=Neisseria leonii TaxID=2995413 RepID=UPI0030D2BEDC
MPFPAKRSSALLISLLLAACAGGGSFDTQNISVNNDPPPAPKEWKDAESRPHQTPQQVEGIMQPALGYSMPIPRRNWSKLDQNGNRIPDGSDAEPYLKLNADNVQAISGTTDTVPHEEKITENLRNPNRPHRVITSKKNSGFQFVHAGFAYSDAGLEMIRKDGNGPIISARTGFKGYVYYQGQTPATALPVGQTATYKGNWHYVTDAKQGRNGRLYGTNDQFAGNRYGLLSNDDTGSFVKSYDSEFQADFAAKKLTGTLKETLVTSHAQNTPEKTRYTIEADIAGNRFRGKAKHLPDDTRLFASDSSLLEGGFYGDKAQELAGKFLADDDSLFAVFAAKQDSVLPAETVFDAKIIDKQNPQDAPQDLTTFGDVTALLVDGRTIPLYPADVKGFVMTTGNNGTTAEICCRNLDNVRFGILSRQGEMQQLFLQGERTPAAAMPQDGQAFYRGTWSAFISGPSEWAAAADNNADSGNRAKFHVDFGNKTIVGELMAAERLTPAFLINGTISGNGFTGTAKTGDRGFSLDPQNANDPKTVHLKAAVSGGFYGDQAQELGGAFSGSRSGYGHSNPDTQFGVVFGAKRQVKNNE